MTKQDFQKVRDVLDQLLCHVDLDASYGARQDHDIAHTKLNHIEKEIERLRLLADSERQRADQAIRQLSGSPF